jgi:hypothetical protein
LSTNRDQVAIIAQQIGSSLDVDNHQWTNRFLVPSTSKPDTYYRVAQRKTDGVWGCDCWAWKRRRACRHLTDILARLASVTVSMPLNDSVLQMLNSARTAFLDLESTPLRFATPPPSRQLDL